MLDKQQTTINNLKIHNRQLLDKKDQMIDLNAAQIHLLATEKELLIGEKKQLQHDLQQIHISLAWRVILKLRKLIELLLPEGSTRKTIYYSFRKYSSHLIRYLKNKPLLAPELIASGEPSTSHDDEDKNSIILVSHDFHRAGAQINLLHGGQELKNNHNKKIIFIALKDGAYRHEFEQIGDEVYALSPDSSDPFVINDQVTELFQQLKVRGIKQCICNTITTGILASLLAKLEFQFLNLIHELPVTIDIYNLHPALQNIKNNSQQIVFSSEYAKRTFVEQYELNPNLCTVKAQGCYFTQAYEDKEQAKAKLREQLFLPKDCKIILTCGHLYTRKGPDAFLNVAKHILSNKGYESYDNTHFIWLGGYAFDDYKWFQHDKIKMGIETHVHYVDFVRDPSLYYAGADIFVLTAREDPFPTVVLESMNNGTPVIAFKDAGGIPELLNNYCGISVPFLDTLKMSQQIINLLNDSDLYNKIAVNAKKRVTNDYNFSQYMSFLLTLLECNPLNMSTNTNTDTNLKVSASTNYKFNRISNNTLHSYISETFTKKKHDEYQSYQPHQKISTAIKYLAFYLPQFHPIPENNEWWGKGFTEWNNVTKAQPQFKGHYQPRLPGELGFYDLRLPEISLRQVELAKNYGINGFCFYHYWFSGRRILEKPLDLMLANLEFDMPFCLCWANENWSRRWDGTEDDILLEQKYLPEDDIHFIKDLSIYLKDSNYIKVDGKPLILIYRPDLLPDAKKSASIWRQWCRDNNIGEIYLCNVHSFDHIDPNSIGYDAAIEFPPNKFPLSYADEKVSIINPEYSGKIYHYPQFIDISYHYQKPNYKCFRGITPSWDNEARREGAGTTFVNSTPKSYQKWLTNISYFTQNNFSKNEQLVFINAWNEWAEGAYLEPDSKFGYAYLESHYQGIKKFERKRLDLILNTQVLPQNPAKIAVILHLYYFNLWDEIKSYLDNIPEPFDLYISVNDQFDSKQLQQLIIDFPNSSLFVFENKGRDIYPFISLFKHIESLNYQSICKIHSKKSNHTHIGDSWRSNIFDALLGSKEQVTTILTKLKQMPDLGLIAPNNYLIRLDDCLGFNASSSKINMEFMNQFIQQLDISIIKDEMFVTGSMFWFKPQALKSLLELNIKESDYPIEQGQIDGTIMHALERVITICARRENYKYIETNT